MTFLPRIACFDLGGVLVRIDLDLGKSSPYADFQSFPAFIALQRGGMSQEEYLLTLAGEMGIEGEQAAAESLILHNRILLGPYPGTLELIEELKGRGVHCGCLSNTNCFHWDEMLNPEKYPNFAALTPELRIASHIVQMEKPDAEIYEHFEQVSRASGDEIAYFDDSPANVDAALARGWRALLIDPNGDPALQIRNFLGL